MELRNDLRRLFPVARIERGLTATCLFLGINAGDIEFLEYLDRRDAGFREELVDKTGNKERDFVACLILGIIPMWNVAF